MTTQAPHPPTAVGTTQGQWDQPFDLHGYHRMARMMGLSDNMAIFRRFNDLNMLSLLELQAEIQLLRDQFYTQCEEDGGQKLNYAMSMKSLRDSQSEQHKQLMTIREKMTQYNALLLQVSQVANLEKPQSSYLARLREWLSDPKGCRKDGVFAHPEGYVWEPKDHRGESHRQDFVTIAAPKSERDYFTQSIIYPLVSLYHRAWGRRHLEKQNVLDLESGVVDYDEERLDRIGMVISTILASILPVIAVLGLFFVKNLLKRIYIMIGITGGFAGLLVLLSNGKGKRIEIFAATATFAAVEVVFIGSSALTS